MMSYGNTLSKILGLAIVLVGVSAADAKADDVSLSDVPEEARRTIEQNVGDGHIEHIERDRRRGETVYEVDFEDRDGRDYELVVAKDGRVITKRRELL